MHYHDEMITHTHTHSHTLTHTYTLTHTHTLSLSLSLTRTHTHTHSHAPDLSGPAFLFLVFHRLCRTVGFLLCGLEGSKASKRMELEGQVQVQVQGDTGMHQVHGRPGVSIAWQWLEGRERRCSSCGHECLLQPHVASSLVAAVRCHAMPCHAIPPGLVQATRPKIPVRPRGRAVPSLVRHAPLRKSFRRASRALKPQITDRSNIAQLIALSPGGVSSAKQQRLDDSGLARPVP